jgi:NADH-quinone oxidoreductase subunit C
VSENDNLVEVTGNETVSRQIDVRIGAFRNSDSGDTSGFGGLVRPVLLPAATSRPFGSYFDAIADQLEANLLQQGIATNTAIDSYVIDLGQMSINVKAEHLVSVAQTLRDVESLRFEVCVSVSGVNFPGDKDRELVASIELLSMTHNRRVRLQVAVPDANPHMPSLTAIWPAADWHERETFDFFGIIFDGHPGLTRIQMPDDWPGHPQRKDYPLGGIPIEYKGATVPAPSERRSY